VEPPATQGTNVAVCSHQESTLYWHNVPPVRFQSWRFDPLTSGANAVNRDYQGAAYETGEREQLCLFTDKGLSEVGVDVVSLAARRGLSRYEITDRWRRW
jgi:hypothetical protein